jgi:transmembrane sensor
MTSRSPPFADSTLDAAVEWMLRLESPHAGEAEWLQFDAWLSADAAHAAAYDRALATATDIRAAAAQRAPVANVIPFPRSPAAPARQERRTLFAGLAAAGLLIVVGAPIWASMQPTVYQTKAGERRSVTLKDGSRIDLNGASRLSVKFSGARRQTTLDGEAVFDITKDAARPFYIAAGDRQIRVVGTQFDVRRREGRFSVAVTRGIVEVAPARNATGATLRLTAGHRLDHTEGAADGHVSTVLAEEALGWRAGRLIYREAPLAEVVADLNAQYERPITLSDGAGSLRFSGVLVLDDQDVVVRRLSLLAPISSNTTKNEIVLRGNVSAR